MKPPLKEKAELCGDFNATPDLRPNKKESLQLGMAQKNLATIVKAQIAQWPKTGFSAERPVVLSLILFHPRHMKDIVDHQPQFLSE